MVDMVKARELRAKGLTYNQISEELDCSVIWCKKNLKGVLVKSSKPMDELVKLAQSKQAITNYEIKAHLMSMNSYPEGSEDILTNDMKKTKRKIMNEEGTVIRPQWMLPHAALSSFKSILESANVLEARIEELVDDFRKDYNLGKEYSGSVRRAIVSLTQGGSGMLYRGVNVECARLEEIANKLDAKNKVFDSNFDGGYYDYIEKDHYIDNGEQDE